MFESDVEWGWVRCSSGIWVEMLGSGGTFGAKVGIRCGLRGWW